MNGYPYTRCDVFTDQPYVGNPLAVVTDASGLDTPAMQRIAAEFNLSETAFVFPGDPPQVRIFTPRSELPFAGHPTIGTAWVLAENGALGTPDADGRHALLEPAGRVAVTIERSGTGELVRAVLTAPSAPVAGPAPPDTATLAAVLGLERTDLHPDWPAGTWSCGVPFLCIPLGTRDALARVRLDHGALRDLSGEWTDKLYAFAPGEEERSLEARMFAPVLGIDEDPATGAAASALAGLLAGITGPGRHGWTIHQGLRMGRPSRLDLEFEVGETGAERVHLGGAAITLGHGQLRAPPA